MKKLTLLQEMKTNTIDINGHVFEILISDDEIFTIPLEVTRVVENADVEKPETVELDVKTLNDLYDRVLGNGALEIISGGKPVPFARRVSWFMAIFDAVSNIYFESLVNKYE